MIRTATVIAAAALLAGCASNPPPEPPVMVAAVDPNSPLAAPMYMQMAASGDLFEIQSSQLAHQMGRSPAVHGFASMLIADHTRMSNEMIAAALTAGLAPPPPALLPHHQAMLDQLRAAGPNFDTVYRDVQVTAHQEALQLHQNYASGGDHPALRAVASAAVPVIQAHLAQAQALAVTAPPPPTPTPQPGERG